MKNDIKELLDKILLVSIGLCIGYGAYTISMHILALLIRLLEQYWMTIAVAASICIFVAGAFWLIDNLIKRIKEEREQKKMIVYTTFVDVEGEPA